MYLLLDVRFVEVLENSLLLEGHFRKGLSKFKGGVPFDSLVLLTKKDFIL
jgi:hypothetical protein